MTISVYVYKLERTAHGADLCGRPVSFYDPAQPDEFRFKTRPDVVLKFFSMPSPGNLLNITIKKIILTFNISQFHNVRRVAITVLDIALI